MEKQNKWSRKLLLTRIHIITVCTDAKFNKAVVDESTYVSRIIRKVCERNKGPAGRGAESRPITRASLEQYKLRTDECPQTSAAYTLQVTIYPIDPAAESHL